MNFPQLHERVLTSQQGEGEFGFRIHKEVFEKYKPTLDEFINVFSQSILNLTKKDKNKVFINEHHRKNRANIRRSFS